MKKNEIILLIVIILLLVGVYFYTRNSDQQNTIQSTLTPTTSTTHSMQSYCAPQDVEASLSLDPGAGNIFGTFTLKNISEKACQIIGNNAIKATYNTQTFKNISLSYLGEVGPEILRLAPNQSVYSQVHYPNGPQCSTDIRTAQVQFSYDIASVGTVTFLDPNGNSKQHIVICTDPSDITPIQIWNISSKPIKQ